MNKRIAVLVSGGGANLQALIDDGICVSLVISSQKDAYALTRAKSYNIESAVVEWDDYKTDREGFGQAILALLKEYSIDLVVCAGFLVILPDSVCNAYPNAILNVHPALIPSFCGEGYHGLKVHQAALERGVKVSGATVHIVNNICDGGPIVLQKAIEVLDGDTPERLQDRVSQIERIILPQAVRMFMNK